ncbi:MAG TPA: GntR family transcriptional regulator, partial [Kineosporiaceae bacterium]|nr:GntR family transcriptional regulator [Kineosporiaceae bacterium]
MTAGKRDARYRIAAAVRSAIEAGEYPPGTRVPGEKELAEQYGVSKMTARAALDLLKIEGLIVARRGSGTHVRESRPIHRRALQRLSATVWQAGQSLWDVETGGRTFTVDQLEIGQETPTEDVARVL